MLLTPTALVNLTEEFGYHVNKEGMCYGFAVMGIQAMMVRDFKTFVNRLDLIANELKTLTLTELVEKIEKLENERGEFYKQVKENREKNLEQNLEQNTSINNHFDLDLLEIRIFLQLLSLYVRPQDYSYLFDENTKPYAQNAAQTFVRGLPAELLKISASMKEDKETGAKILEYEEEALIKKADSFAGFYDENELKTYFDLLCHAPGDVSEQKELAPNFDPPISLLLTNGEHTISVVYNKDNSCWQLIDASKLPITNLSFKTKEELTKQILTSLSTNKITTFNTEIYCEKDQLNSVQTWLSDLKKTKEWINLFKIDGKENLVDYKGATLFMNAAEIGDINLVKALLASPKFITANKSSDGWTALDLAAENGHAEVIKELLASQKIILPKGGIGWTPLHRAAKNGHIDAVAAFLASNKVTVEKASADGRTPIYMAAADGRAEVVKLFLSNSRCYYPNQAKNDGWTPLSIAANNGHVQVVRELLASYKVDNQNAVRPDGLTTFYFAVKNGDSGIVKAFLESSVEKDILNSSAAINVEDLPSDSPSKQVLKDLFESKQITNDFTPLQAAIIFGRTEIAKELIAAGFDVNEKVQNNTSAIELAIATHQVDIIKLLEDAGARLVDSQEVKIHIDEQSVIQPNVQEEVFKSEADLDSYCQNQIRKLQPKYFSLYGPSPLIEEYKSILQLGSSSKLEIISAMNKDLSYLEKHHFIIKKIFKTSMGNLFKLKKDGILDFQYQNPVAIDLVAQIKSRGNDFTDAGIAKIFTDEKHPHHGIFESEGKAKSEEKIFLTNMALLTKDLKDIYAIESKTPSRKLEGN